MTRPVPSARAVRIGAKWRPDTAPRRIPLLMRWATRLAQVPAQLAWLVALGGVVGAMFVVPKVDLHPPVNKTFAHGTIVARGDDTIVYDLVVGERTYRNSGIYYGTSAAGEQVRVWYDPRDPSRSTTVPDQPDYDYGAGSLLVLAFPAGAIVVAFAFMWHRRRFRLLRYGRATEARVRTSERTRGGRTAYLNFKYMIDGTEHSANVTTVRAGDERGPEIVLYDPSEPNHACPLADLVGKPRLEGDRFVPTSLPYAAFALPLATLAAIGILVAKTL